MLRQRFAAGEPMLRVDIGDGDGGNRRALRRWVAVSSAISLAIVADSLASGLPVTLMLMMGIFLSFV